MYPNDAFQNITILVSGGDATSALISNILPDLHTNGDSQCFPLYWYEKVEGKEDLFGKQDDKYVRHDAITDEALAVFREAYPHAFVGRYKKDGGVELNKEDIFYYIYGILHSPEYRKRFEANLKKGLPRIPLAEDFAAFSRAGRALAYLHLNYVTVEPWGTIEEENDYPDVGRVSKMTFGKCKKTDENPKGIDRTVLHVTDHVTLYGIPEEAYEYVVNGRSAIEWLMDQYTTQQSKGCREANIINDPNEYSDNPRYFVDLVKSIVTVSMETLEIVHQLPPLHEKPQPANWHSAWKTD